MLKIVAVFVATIMVMQVFAAEHEVEGLKQLQKQFHSFQQQMQEENQQLTKQLSQQIDAMQQQWLAEEIELKEENHKLNQRIEELEEGNNLFQNKAENLFGKVTHLHHLVDKVMGQHKHNNSLVAFSAFASKTRPYDERAIVQFDTVITNEGGLYSGQTSTFTCAYPGFYLFSVNVRSGGANYMDADIEIGGDRVASVWAHNHDDSVSNTVIAYCQQAKQVYVRATRNDHSMVGDPSAPISKFTGILLYSA